VDTTGPMPVVAPCPVSASVGLWGTRFA
jgi:hypothetical protein